MEYAKIMLGDFMGDSIWTWIFVAVIVLVGAFFAVMLLLWVTSKRVKAEFLRFDGRKWFPVAVYRIGESEYRNILPTGTRMKYLYSAGNVKTVWKSRFFGFVIDGNTFATIIIGAALVIPTAVRLIIVR